MARVLWRALASSDLEEWSLIYKKTQEKYRIRTGENLQEMKIEMGYHRGIDKDKRRSTSSCARGNGDNHCREIATRDGIMEQMKKGKGKFRRDSFSSSAPNGEWGEETNHIRDVVLSKVSDDGFRGGSGPSAFPSKSPSSPLKRRKMSNRAQNLSPGDEVSPGLQAASYLDTEYGTESSSDYPNPSRAEDVDNFVMHSSTSLVSITKLPVLIDGGVKPSVKGGTGCPEVVQVTGWTGNRQVTKTVTMWQLKHRKDFKPLFLLKTTNGSWLRLKNPEPSYRRVMIEAYTLAYFLDFVKKFPSETEKKAEEYLVQKCRKYGERPSLDKLSRHLKVIRSFAEEDRDIEGASVLRKIFPNFLAKDTGAGLKVSHNMIKSGQRLDSMKDVKATASRTRHSDSDPSVPPSQVLLSDDENLAVTCTMDKGGVTPLQLPFKSSNPERTKKGVKVMAKKVPKSESPSDIDEDPDIHPYQVPKRSNTGVQPQNFTSAEVNVEDPPICVLCDDGGRLIYCEGPCQRHFHPTKASGAESFCDTLCLSEAEVKGMGKYFCKNCTTMQHQCFICGSLGSASARSHGPHEVRCCDLKFCKRFYHVECAAEMVAPRSDWRALAEDISSGIKELYCPRHCCSLCGHADLENPGSFVQCRRCPKAWHKSCLLDFSRSGELATTPIWRQHGRDFIYCRMHKIDPKLLTPKRNHLKFPPSRPSLAKGKGKLVKIGHK